MKVRVFTEFTFDSAHRLSSYDGPCASIHGHTWLVQVWVQGDEIQLNDMGILVDFSDIRGITRDLDHKYILPDDDFFAKLGMEGNRANPTAENLATAICRTLREEAGSHLQYCVRVYEKAVGTKSYAQTGDFLID